MDLNLPTERQYEIWRKMTPTEKYGVFLKIMNDVRLLKTAGVKMQHPDWSEEEVQKEVARQYLHARS